MRALLALPCLLLSACQLNPPMATDAISQYLCPNELILRVSYNEDKSLMLLGINGRTHTLSRNVATGNYSNGYYTTTIDEQLLRLKIVGVLLPQTCRLQIAADATSGR